MRVYSQKCTSRESKEFVGAEKENTIINKRDSVVNPINFYNFTYVTQVTSTITHTHTEIRFSPERGEAVEV